MPLPDNREETFEVIKGWCLGDVSATEFLIEIAEISRLADDIIDEPENRQRNLCWLISRLLSRLPRNSFYISNIDRLEPSLNLALNGWRLSDDWRDSGECNKEVFGFVLRESTDQIIISVAFIIGGHEHAFKVSKEIFELCHADSRETIQDWVKG